MMTFLRRDDVFRHKLHHHDANYVIASHGYETGKVLRRNGATKASPPISDSNQAGGQLANCVHATLGIINIHGLLLNDQVTKTNGFGINYCDGDCETKSRWLDEVTQSSGCGITDFNAPLNNQGIWNK